MLSWKKKTTIIRLIPIKAIGLLDIRVLIEHCTILMTNEKQTNNYCKHFQDENKNIYIIFEFKLDWKLCVLSQFLQISG